MGGHFECSPCQLLCLFNTESSVLINSNFLRALIGVFAELGCLFILNQNQFAQGIHVVDTLFVCSFVIVVDKFLIAGLDQLPICFMQ